MQDIRIHGNISVNAEPSFYVTAAQQKDTIVKALKNAGFSIEDRMGNSTHLLRVTIGIDRATKPCGTLNNVRYQIRIRKQTVLVAEAKGWTGSCYPNIFDLVSRKLKQYIVETTN